MDNYSLRNEEVIGIFRALVVPASYVCRRACSHRPLFPTEVQKAVRLKMLPMAPLPMKGRERNLLMAGMSLS